MPDDAGAAAGTAEGAGTTSTPGSAAGDGQRVAPAPAATFTAPAADNRAAEDMLADAVSGDGEGDGEGGEGDGGDDPAKLLAKAQAEAKKWRDLSKKNEGRARTNAEKAAEFDKLTEAQKTEQQRLTDRATLAEQRAAKAEGLYHRTLAAATYELPPSLIPFIADGTEDEITSSAETLAAEFNARVDEQVTARVAALTAASGANGNAATASAAAAAHQQRRPVESMRPGAAPASASGPLTGRSWLSDQYAALKNQ